MFVFSLFNYKLIDKYLLLLLQRLLH